MTSAKKPEVRTMPGDISTRSQTDDLRQSLGAAMATMVAAVSLIRVSDGVMVYTNPHFDELFGYDPDELTGKHVSIVNAPADGAREELAAEVSTCVREKGSWQGDVHSIRKDGGRFWCRASVSAYTDPRHGEVYVAVQRDITARKLAEEALRASKQILDGIMNAIPVRVFWKDRNLTYLGCNAAFARDAGFADSQDVIGKDDYQMGWRAQADVYRADDRQVIERGCPKLLIEETQTTPSGSTLTLLTSKLPLRDSSGEISGVLGTYMDVTERKQAESIVQVRMDLLDYSMGHSLDQVLQRTLDEVGRLVDSPIGFYHFLAEDQKTLTLKAWSTRTEREFCKATGKGSHYAVDEAGVWVDCIRERRPVIHNDYLSLPSRKGLPDGHAAVVRELVVPILRNDRIVAILGVGNKPLNYTDQDVKLVTYLADVAWEIAEHKRAEAALLESEGRFRELSAVTSEGIMVHRDFVILDANQAFAALLGVPRANDLVGRNALEVTPLTPESRQRVFAHSRAQSTETYEIELVRPDGAILSVETHATEITYRGSQARLVSMRDITERKRAEEARMRSHELLANLARLVPGVVYQYRLYPDGRSAFPYASPGMYDIYEVTPEEVREDATPVFGRLHPDDHDRVAATIQESARTLQEFYCEFRVILPAQGLRWRWSQAHPERTDDGGTLWHGIIMDITERKRAEEAKASLEVQVRQVQKMESVGQLAGGVAHDFNNLLMGIMNYVELCRDGLPPEHSVRGYLDEITRDAQRSADITKQLLAFARKQVIAPKVLDLNDALVGMLKMLRHLLGEDIAVNWMPGTHLWPIKVDPGQLDQILVNLCINARDAIAGVGRVTIGTTNVTLDRAHCAENPGARPGEYAVLTVSDTGCGMGDDVIAHIFEPFYTTKEVGKGTGLGLATVYGIVEQNHGHIEVQSEVGKGTTFSIHLPRATSAADSGSVAATPERLPRGTETILLAEDEKSVRVTSRLFLEALGYTVLAAERPEEALRLAGAHAGSIHLLITDVIMPGMNGPDLAGRLAEKHPNLKCLFMSGYTADVMTQRGALGAEVPFLPKPFSRHDLARKVREVLDGGGAATPSS
jgi:PAS domain S-box-containing protein